MEKQVIVLTDAVDKKHSVCYKAKGNDVAITAIYLMCAVSTRMQRVLFTGPKTSANGHGTGMTTTSAKTAGSNTHPATDRCRLTPPIELTTNVQPA